MKNIEWRETYKEGKELVLATCSKNNEPHANIVISLGFEDNKLLIADCEMKTTIKNLKENRRIVVVSGHYRVTGTVQTFTSGKYFDICVGKAGDRKVKNAILVDIEKVFDLDKQEMVFERI